MLPQPPELSLHLDTKNLKVAAVITGHFGLKHQSIEKWN